MIRQAFSLCLLTGLVLGVAGCATAPGPVTINPKEIVPRKGVDPKANEILYRASRYLQQAKTFQFQADISRDVITYDGARVEFDGELTLTVRRPNKLRGVFKGDEVRRRSYFNGKTLTIYQPNQKFYAQEKISGTIDNAIDHIYEKYGFSVPLSDLVYSDPYAVMIENVDRGYLIGRHTMNGVLCDHLLFQQERIDWQVWIEADSTPLIRKILITYKEENGTPEYEAFISHWKLNLSVDDDDFDFTPPKNADEIEFLPPKKGFVGDEEPQNNNETEGN